MNKRFLGTSLWFLVGWTVGSMLTFFAGLPEGLNIGLAVIAAGFVWWDPGHLLWPQGRRIVKNVPTTHRAGGRLIAE